MRWLALFFQLPRPGLVGYQIVDPLGYADTNADLLI
jgi:hypothetical protein